jgi:hypothetical protein
MKIFQMPRFKAYVKKLQRPFQQIILDEIEDIYENPEAGELKTGDLQGIRVHKFTMNQQLTMIVRMILLFCIMPGLMKIFTEI